MKDVKELVVEETVENVAEDAITADLDVAGADIAGVVFKVLIAVGIAVGTGVLYKMVIKPKLDARKAQQDNDANNGQSDGQ